MNGRGQCLDLRSHPADQLCLSCVLFDELCVLSFRKAQLFFQHGYYPPVIHGVKVWIIMKKDGIAETHTETQEIKLSFRFVCRSVSYADIGRHIQ